jgi:hypothetical protein
MPQGSSAAARIKSMKNPNDPIGNRIRDLPASSAVPQQTAPLRTVQMSDISCDTTWREYTFKKVPETETEEAKMTHQHLQGGKEGSK